MSSKLCPSHNFALIWPGLGACASTLFYRLLGSAQLENLNMILDQEFWVKSFGSRVLGQDFCIRSVGSNVLDQEFGMFKPSMDEENSECSFLAGMI